jgi:chromatin remodeling complex protein RSC6
MEKITILEEKEILIFNSKLFLRLKQHFKCLYVQYILFGNMSAEKILKILLDRKLQALFHSQTQKSNLMNHIGMFKLLKSVS